MTAPADPDVLADLQRAADRKWRGDPHCQQAGLFARAAAEIVALRSVALGRVRHAYAGDCPSPTRPESRDGACPACQILGPHKP